MRAIALLELIIGFLAPLILDGQVFRHAVLGVVCVVIAFTGALLLRRGHSSNPQRKRGARIVAGCGVVLATVSLSNLPSAFHSQERFDDRMEPIRRMQKE